MSATLTELKEVEKLSPAIIRILGLNPGPFTLQGTNTYLLGTGEERILIDAGEGKEGYIEHLQEVLNNEKCYIKQILITHYHYDHTGGIASILEKLKQKNGEVIKVYKKLSPLDNPQYCFEALNGNEEFQVEGATVRAFHTPGHTDDHLCFYFNEESAVISGDCILGEGTSVFQELGEYMRSLEKIKDLKPAIIYPAHGPVILDSIPRIEMYINHRLQRESQIVQTLTEKSPLSSIDIVTSVYPGLPEGVLRGAINNVNLHLRKLLLEGVVSLVDGDQCVLESDQNAGECCKFDNTRSDFVWSLSNPPKM